MELLGFEGLVVNTQDSVASWDFIADFASAVAIHMTNLSRLGADLKIWSSDEWAMVDLDEAYTGTSSIMPQKKNPLVVEHITLSSSECIGALVTIMSSLNGMEYGFSLESARLSPYILDLALGSTKVMAGFAATVRPMEARMLQLATEGFSPTTELADTLVRATDISFRQAHDVVAHTVLRAIAEGKTANQITADMVQDAAVESIGEKLNITDEDILLALDPTENVKRRSIVGGPAPQEVQRAIEDRWQKIRSQEARLMERLEGIKNAREKLKEAEAIILSEVQE
jgi:argininosuccinate lyase